MAMSTLSVKEIFECHEQLKRVDTSSLSVHEMMTLGLVMRELRGYVKEAQSTYQKIQDAHKPEAGESNRKILTAEDPVGLEKKLAELYTYRIKIEGKIPFEMAQKLDLEKIADLYPIIDFSPNGNAR